MCYKGQNSIVKEQTEDQDFFSKGIKSNWQILFFFLLNKTQLRYRIVINWATLVKLSDRENARFWHSDLFGWWLASRADP